MSTSSISTRRRWLAFAAILAAGVMDLLDSTVANIAAPSIRADLGGSYADLEWITVGYTLAMAVTLLVGGRLGDMLGRRRMLLGGMAGFTVASMACAVAVSPETLVAARAVQGAFGALMLPQVFGLIREVFGPEDMSKAFGVLGPVMGLAAVLGPIVAGALIGADVLGTEWRMIFLVNVPVGLAALAVGARTLPAGAPASGVRLDVRGAVLAAAGTGLLVYPLVQGRDLGWPAWVVGLLVVSVPALAAFAAGQVRRKRAGGSPLVEPSVFTHRSFVAGIAFAVVFLGSMGGVVLTLGVFLQAGLGYTPIHAALTNAPWAVGAFLGSGAASVVMARLGRRVLHVGLAVMGAGLAWLVVVLADQGTAVGSWDFARRCSSPAWAWGRSGSRCSTSSSAAWPTTRSARPRASCRPSSSSACPSASP